MRCEALTDEVVMEGAVVVSRSDDKRRAKV